MAYLQYNDSKIVLAECPNCHKKNTVKEWDERGQKEWGSYESMHGLLVSKGPGAISSLIFACPACKTRIWNSRDIKISISLRTNKDALQLLKK